MLGLLGLLLGRSSKSRSSLLATIGVLAGALRLLRRATARQEKVVFSERLRPGERLVITNAVPDRGRRRARSRRSAANVARPPG